MTYGCLQKQTTLCSSVYVCVHVMMRSATMSVFLRWVCFGMVFATHVTSFPAEYINKKQRSLIYHAESDKPYETTEYSQQLELISHTKHGGSDEGFDVGTVSIPPESSACTTDRYSLDLVLESQLLCRLLGDKYVNCSDSNLHNLPTTEFPKEIKIYDLSQNHLASLPSNAFSRYSMLRELNLRQNIISRIDPLAFIGLSRLQILNLSDNKLVMNETTLKNAFSERVFVPLKNLRTLRLERNNPQPDSEALRYPDKALSQLSGLEELSLDGFENAIFETGFAKLSRLRHLWLDGYKLGNCKLYGLKNETFQYLTQLEHLSMTDCHLQGHRIEAGAFLHLENLKSLNISFNQDINVQFFDRVFYGLQYTSTLKELRMQFVVNLYTLGVCLSSRYIKYFPQSIEYLDIRENKLECIDRNVIDKLTWLKVLDISKNNFVFGTYLLDLPKLKRLTTLYIDNYQLSANRLPRIYPFNPQTPPLESDNCSLYAQDERGSENGKFILRLPPNLTKITVRYAGLRYIFSELEIDSNNSLEHLVMEGNYIPILEGPIHGLNNLKNCNLIASKIFKISETFFKTLSSVTHLNLSTNRLGDFLGDTRETNMFQSLRELKSLDLSMNTIWVLGETLFHGLDNLEYLRISHNPIYHFRSDISIMNNLQFLIAADTGIMYLSIDTRDFITRRVQNGSSFSVNLQMAPILCDCGNLPFITWMVRSKTFDFNNTIYLCRYQDTSVLKIKDGYENTLKALSRQCVSHKVLYFIVGGVMLFFAIFLSVALFYRYRWNLKYAYHAVLMSRRPNGDTNASNTYGHDVFVCYAEEDKHFVMNLLLPALENRGLSVFVHHRDFRAGELIGTNIIRAVHNCRRTVMVLTRNHVKSDWCKFELQMANRESVRRGNSVLIFILFDNITVAGMGIELLYNVQNNTYIEFPSSTVENENILNTLWDKLARDIRY